jgi:hypothetical protein
MAGQGGGGRKNLAPAGEAPRSLRALAPCGRPAGTTRPANVAASARKAQGKGRHRDGLGHIHNHRKAGAVVPMEKIRQDRKRFSIGGCEFSLSISVLPTQGRGKDHSSRG